MICDYTYNTPQLNRSAKLLKNKNYNNKKSLPHFHFGSKTKCVRKIATLMNCTQNKDACRP